MEKDFMYNDYTGDSVINRGYEIYDGWKEKTTVSRKIVAEAERAVSAVNTNKSKAASIEALACLFALDMRVKERYSGLLQCLLFYFSWRRETRALNMLRATLCIPEGETDIRTAIEVKLQNLREEIEADEADGDDNETHGGKRNGSSDEEDAVTEEKGQEQTAEEKTDDLAEAEETEEGIEEKAEDLAENEASSKEEIDEAAEITEEAQEVPEAEAQEEAEQELQEERYELDEIKEENNAPDEESEPSIDTEKTKEARTYNDEVDSPPLYEETTRTAKTETTSFIDEMIIDNMVKGKMGYIGHDPIENAKQDKETNRATDTAELQNEDSKSKEKDAYLYDKTLLTEKGSEQKLNEKNAEQKLNEKSGDSKQIEKTTESKNVQDKEQPKSSEKLENIKNDTDNMRVPLQVDITNQQEVQMIRELNDTMSIESKLEYIRMQEDMFREQIRISNKEIGIDDNIGVFPIKESDTTSQLTAIQNKK